MKRATIPLLCLGLFLSVQAKALETPRFFRQGLWESVLKTSYLYSDSNYGSGGGTSALAANGQYQMADFEMRTRYVWAPGLAFSGEAHVTWAESKGLDATRANSSLTSAGVGVETFLKWGDAEFVPEISLLMPVEKVDPASDNVMNSEGVSVTRLRMHGLYPVSGGILFGMLGYDLRGGGRSNLLPWSLGAEFRLGTARLGGRLFGAQSVSEDTDAGSSREASRYATSLRVNAGSLRFYSMNPSVIDSEAFMTFALTSNFRLGVSAGLTLTGTNTSMGYHGDVAVLYRNMGSIKRSSSIYPTQSEDPYSDQFKEDVDDGVDQKLFRPLPAPRRQQQAPPSQTDEEVYREEEAERARRAERARQNMQNNLDNAEMSIQLKMDKKKKKKPRR